MLHLVFECAVVFISVGVVYLCALNSKEITFMRLAVALLAGVITAGCGTSPPREDKIGRLKEIAIVVDATILNDRTNQPSLLNVAESDAIARHLENIAAERLRAKGYLARPVIRTIGLGFDRSQNIEVEYETKAEIGSRASSPPFAMLVRGDNVSASKIDELHGAAIEDRLPANGSPLGPMPILFIGARGKFISGGAVVANIGKIAVNVVIVAATIAARGGSGNGLELEEDTLELTLKLFDPRIPNTPPDQGPTRCAGVGREGVRSRGSENAEEVLACGPLLWRARKYVARDPDEHNFTMEIEALLKSLPPAKR
jgi:hypothetical protein